MLTRTEVDMVNEHPAPLRTFAAVVAAILVGATSLKTWPVPSAAT